MRVILAYISVILLWATTPLAIKWSGEGPGFLFGVSGRMVIGIVCVSVVLLLSHQKLIWHSKARKTYFAVTVQIYGAMMAVYWAAQFIPSGWISVIFGLSPLVTALIAAFWLNERSLSAAKICAYIFGLCGLALMFGSALKFGNQAIFGISGVLLAVFLQAISAVWVKRIDAKLPAVSQVTGGLLLAVPAYLVTWFVVDGQWPVALSQYNIIAIVYLGVIATSIGFVLYYYVLTHLSATRVALITLVSPVMALFIGYRLNHEPLTIKIAAGTTLILLALVLHEMGGWTTAKNK
jgi:drug/metabolite transporter (DMT)-like permease